LEEARLFGGWTRDKLELLRLYLLAYRRVAGAGGTYIDGFASTGIVKIRGEAGERLGSAATALDVRAFSHLYFYEQDSLKMSQLQRNIQLRFEQRRWIRARWRVGDFNEEVLKDLRPDRIPLNKPTFAFLDPDSTQLGWTTVEALARYKEAPGLFKTELLILLNTDQALVRLVPRHQNSSYATSGDALKMDWVMGDRNAWWDLNDQRFSAVSLMVRYVDRLKGLGYLDVRAIPILHPETRVRQYFLIHASDHPAAAGLMDWSEREAAPTRKDQPVGPDLFDTLE
jgi:three-Cys-motif partner protein